jgi:hypothetical protein
MTNIFKIIKKAENEDGPIIHGTSIDVFHRTREQETVGNICESGFIAGMGAMYGVGIYANYTLKSAMAQYGLGAYGGIVVRGSVDLNGFLIFDYNIAKRIYGENYRIYDQVENIIGWNSFLPSASEKNIAQMRRTLKEIHSFLRSNPKKTSKSAQMLFPRRGLNVNGILFTGENDGNTVVVFNGSLVIPKAHAFIDQRTKSSFKWKPCSSSSVETFEAMIEASKGNDWKQVNDQRTQLIKAVSNRSEINLRKENYPLVPDVVFDNIIINAIYEDKSRKLSPHLEARLKDIYPSKILLKKIQSEPLLYWKEYKKADDSVKAKINPDEIKNTWQAYVDENPLKWKDIPSEIKGMVDQNNVTDYYIDIVSQNPSNLMHVPNDLKSNVRRNVQITDKKLQEIQERQKESDVVLEQSDTFEIPTSSMGWFEKEIEKLNRKANKLGLPPIIVDVVGEDVKAYTKTIQITRNVPLLKGGWELVAKIIPIRDDETENVVNNLQKLGTKAVPEEYLNVDAQCQHCNTNRNRNEIFVLYSEEKSKHIMVGSTCLNEFIGEYTLRPDQVAKYAEQLQQTISMFRNNEKFSGRKRDPQDVRRDFRNTGIPLPYFLSRCLMSMKKDGFVSGGQAFKERSVSTGQKAFDACLSEKIDNSLYEELSSNEMVWIDSTIDWLYNLSPTEVKGNDYLYNLSTVAKLGVANKSNKNYLASALNAYKRYMDDQVIDNKQIVDGVGKEVYFSGTLLDKRPLFFSVTSGDSIGSESNYCIAKNTNGDLIVWGDKRNLSSEIDDAINIKGTVSGFKFVDDKSATILEDVEVIDDQTFAENKEAQEARTKEFRETNPNKLEKTVYNSGDKVDALFEVLKAQITSRGNVFYQVQDEFGTRLSLFTMPPLRHKAGDKIMVQGTIALQDRFINIDSPVVSDEHGNRPEEVVEGDIEKIFYVDDIFVDGYGNDKFSLKDADGNMFEAGVTNSTRELSVGDYAILKGQVKAGYQGRWKLLRVKLINKSSSFPQQNTQINENNENNEIPEKEKETEDIQASNWYKKSLKKEG